MAGGPPKVSELIQTVLALQASPENEVQRAALLEQMPTAFGYSRWDNLPKDSYIAIALEVLETESGARTFRSTLRENRTVGSRVLLIDGIDVDWNMGNGIEQIQFTLVDGSSTTPVLTLKARVKESAEIFSGINDVIHAFIVQARNANEDFERIGQPYNYTPVEGLSDR